MLAVLCVPQVTAYIYTNLVQKVREYSGKKQESSVFATAIIGTVVGSVALPWSAFYRFLYGVGDLHTETLFSLIMCTVQVSEYATAPDKIDSLGWILAATFLIVCAWKFWRADEDDLLHRVMFVASTISWLVDGLVYAHFNSRSLVPMQLAPYLHRVYGVAMSLPVMHHVWVSKDLKPSFLVLCATNCLILGPVMKSKTVFPPLISKNHFASISKLLLPMPEEEQHMRLRLLDGDADSVPSLEETDEACPLPNIPPSTSYSRPPPSPSHPVNSHPPPSSAFSSETPPPPSASFVAQPASSVSLKQRKKQKKPSSSASGPSSSVSASAAAPVRYSHVPPKPVDNLVDESQDIL